ncbi:hypothetical protein LY78DRAFT_681111 [Colletotrichum sublineola]|nr:hypothetical protein LY78DRAFT_681111 [Colletotrichum sublineola]
MQAGTTGLSMMTALHIMRSTAQRVEARTLGGKAHNTVKSYDVHDAALRGLHRAAQVKDVQKGRGSGWYAAIWAWYTT